MKAFLPLLLICLWMVSCSSEGTSEQTNNSATTTTTATADHADVGDDHSGHNHDGHNHDGDNHDGHDHSNDAGTTHIKASADAPWVGLWALKHAIRASDKDYASKHKGKWYHFKADNTFESGKWSDQTNKGTWSLDEKTNFININYSEKLPDELPGQWKVQGGGSSMIWIGNTDKNSTGAQIKFDQSDARPIKE